MKIGEAGLALALSIFPVQAAEPVKVDVVCNKGWCAIRQDTLKALLENAQKLAAHTTELRALCGWNR